MTPFLKRVILFSSGGPFLDGYVLSLIGVAITQLQPLLHLTEQESAMIGVASLVGVFIGTLIGGYITDKIGRKTMFTIDIVAIVLFSLASMLAGNVVWLIVLRLSMGIFIGADYPIATSLVAEFAPKRYRAYAMGWLSATWYIGATAAALVGFLLADVSGGWRWMLGSAAIPGVILLIGRWGIPESPRWLARKGRQDEALAITRQLFGANVALDEEETRAPMKYRTIFSEGYLRRFVFVVIMFIAQIIPMWAIYTFGPQIMSSFGLHSAKQAIFGEAIISLFFILGTIPGMVWLNRFGRRTMIIVGFSVMTLALAFLWLFPTAATILVLAAFALYAFASGGPGILQWLYPNELFPTEIRASAVGLTIAVSRIGTIVSTYMLPSFLTRHGIGPTMGIAVGITVVGLVTSIILAPETRGKSLQETSVLLRKK